MQLNNLFMFFTNLHTFSNISKTTKAAVRIIISKARLLGGLVHLTGDTHSEEHGEVNDGGIGMI